MKRGRAETIIREVQDSVSHWRDYADEIVPTAWREKNPTDPSVGYYLNIE